jgi:hypothetical protein
MNGLNRCVLALVLALASPAALAERGGPLGPEWVAMSPDRLDRLRGGFSLPSGLVLSFGIERLVFVNGDVVASARVRIPDVSRITAEQARDLARLQQGMVVQLGDGNAFDPSGAINGVVIQNGRDGQDIRTLTTLDVGVGSLGLFQHLNANAALQDALNAAAGVP